jgi:hypothetical protein
MGTKVSGENYATIFRVGDSGIMFPEKNNVNRNCSENLIFGEFGLVENILFTEIGDIRYLPIPAAKWLIRSCVPFGSLRLL